MQGNKRPPLSLPIFLKIFVLALFGVTIHQSVYYAGLDYTSATVATALSNIIPALTFVLAVLLRMEKVRIRTAKGKAKILGTLAKMDAPNPEKDPLPIVAAEDVCSRNTSFVVLRSCQSPDPFITSLVRGKLIICTITRDSSTSSIDTILSTIKEIGAAGVIIIMDNDVGSEPLSGPASAFQLPGILLGNSDASEELWEYYNGHTIRGRNGAVISFAATGRIMDGRRAIYTQQGPVVARYSSRGPDVNSALMQTADVLKPNIMAPGTSIWAAWSTLSTQERFYEESLHGRSFR